MCKEALGDAVPAGPHRGLTQRPLAPAGVTPSPNVGGGRKSHRANRHDGRAQSLGSSSEQSCPHDALGITTTHLARVRPGPAAACPATPSCRRPRESDPQLRRLGLAGAHVASPVGRSEAAFAQPSPQARAVVGLVTVGAAQLHRSSGSTRRPDHDIPAHRGQRPIRGRPRPHPRTPWTRLNRGLALELSSAPTLAHQPHPPAVSDGESGDRGPVSPWLSPVRGAVTRAVTGELVDGLVGLVLQPHGLS
jgi:hypothetical protein